MKRKSWIYWSLDTVFWVFVFSTCIEAFAALVDLVLGNFGDAWEEAGRACVDSFAMMGAGLLAEEAEKHESIS